MCISIKIHEIWHFSSISTHFVMSPPPPLATARTSDSALAVGSWLCMRYKCKSLSYCIVQWKFLDFCEYISIHTLSFAVCHTSAISKWVTGENYLFPSYVADRLTFVMSDGNKFAVYYICRSRKHFSVNGYTTPWNKWRPVKFLWIFETLSVNCLWNFAYFENLLWASTFFPVN